MNEKYALRWVFALLLQIYTYSLYRIFCEFESQFVTLGHKSSL